MQPIETEGRTVAEAVDAALRQSGLRRDQVEVTVLAEGAAGFMGIGAKPAKVRLTEKRWGDSPAPAPSKPAAPAPRPPRPAPPKAEKKLPRPYIPPPTPVPPKPAPKPEPKPEPVAEARREPRPAAPRREDRPPRAERPAPRPVTPAEAAAACEKARDLVLELLKLMTIAAPTATSSWDADLERVKISVESQDASLLVGRDGRVLESLQFLATLMMSRGAEVPVAVQVDALSYWEKRETAILDEARRGADSAKATGKPVRLEPMDASMRRLIHRTLASSPDVTTSSEGEGTWRKIVIRPRSG